MNVRPFLASSLIALAVSAHGAPCFADTPAEYPKTGFLLEGRVVVQPIRFIGIDDFRINYGGGAMIGFRHQRFVSGFGVDFLIEKKMHGNEYYDSRSSSERQLLRFSPTMQFVFARSKGRWVEGFVQGSMHLEIAFIQGQVSYDTGTIKSNRTEVGPLFTAGLGLRAWVSQHVALSFPIAFGVPSYFLNITPGVTGVF